jgi:propanol-preferring alcohol dehydrogenase
METMSAMSECTAMVLQQPGRIEDAPLRRLERSVPQAGEGELLLHVEACAVCRTDLQIIEGDIEARELPIVPGHQVVGVVEQLGEGVTGWNVGERAAITWLAETCGVCQFCTSGRENLCLNARFTGWDRDGGYANYVTVRADYAVHLPHRLQPGDAAPLLCGGVIGYRSLKRSEIQPGQRLGLFGYGASAHLALQVARYWQCEVYVFTRSQNDRERAMAMGATWAGGYKDSPGVLLDAAITFAPVGDVVIDALGAVNRGGIVTINAIHLDRIPQFSYDLLWWERELRSVANVTREDAREFIELAERIPIRTDIQTFPMGEANEALRMLKQGELSGTAVLLP